MSRVCYYDLRQLYPELVFSTPTDSMRVLEPKRFTSGANEIIYDGEYDPDYIIDQEKLPDSPELALLQSIHEES